jgi:hypothetical protein
MDETTYFILSYFLFVWVLLLVVKKFEYKCTTWTWVSSIRNVRKISVIVKDQCMNNKEGTGAWLCGTIPYFLLTMPPGCKYELKFWKINLTKSRI